MAGMLSVLGSDRGSGWSDEGAGDGPDCGAGGGGGAEGGTDGGGAAGRGGRVHGGDALCRAGGSGGRTEGCWGAGVRRGSGAEEAGGPGDAFASPDTDAGAAAGPAGRPSSPAHQMPPITSENASKAVLARR